MIRKDGKRVWVEINSLPIKIGRKRRVLGIARNITERKRAEENLRESEERHRTIFTSALNPIWVVKVKDGGEFVYEDVNPEYCDFTGLDRRM